MSNNQLILKFSFQQIKYSLEIQYFPSQNFGYLIFNFLEEKSENNKISLDVTKVN
jgi:hypothetical protein